MAVFTYETEIKTTEYNREVCEYFSDYIPVFNQLQRKIWHRVKYSYITTGKCNRTQQQELVKDLIPEYRFTTRAFNAVLANMTGRYKALLELKKTEKKQLEIQIKRLEREVKELDRDRTRRHSKIIVKPTAKRIMKYKQVKQKLYWKKNLLNKKKQQLVQLKLNLKQKRVSLCFGSKKNLKKNFQQFLNQRDSELFFLGRASERSGNMNFQLTYNPTNNQFDFKVRKECNTEESKYSYGRVYFNQKVTKVIRQTLREKSSPVTIRIKRRNNRYYLQIMVQLNKDYQVITSSFEGTIGVDFNQGFVSVSEINKQGNLVNTFNLDYRFKQGTKTDNDLKVIAEKLKQYCLDTGKDLVIEDLNFLTKKAQTQKGKNKKYNEMLHSLSYRNFSHILEGKCIRNEILLVKVNPAWTSWTGENKYGFSKKLNIHTAASYVIARRGKGLTDVIN